MVSIVSVALATTAVLLCSSPLLGQQQERLGPANFCIAEGVYHKAAPSREEALEACQLWQNNSCCTPETTRRINRDMGVTGLYNFSWELCGQLSQECHNYIQVPCVESVILCATGKSCDLMLWYIATCQPKTLDRLLDYDFTNFPWTIRFGDMLRGLAIAFTIFRTVLL